MRAQRSDKVFIKQIVLRVHDVLRVSRTRGEKKASIGNREAGGGGGETLRTRISPGYTVDSGRAAHRIYFVQFVSALVEIKW